LPKVCKLEKKLSEFRSEIFVSHHGLNWNRRHCLFVTTKAEEESHEVHFISQLL